MSENTSMTMTDRLSKGMLVSLALSYLLGLLVVSINSGVESAVWAAIPTFGIFAIYMVADVLANSRWRISRVVSIGGILLVLVSGALLATIIETSTQSHRPHFLQQGFNQAPISPDIDGIRKGMPNLPRPVVPLPSTEVPSLPRIENIPATVKVPQNPTPIVPKKVHTVSVGKPT